MDYKDKIAKLLALAKSPNENEAKAALLKARALMAEHKLREEDCVKAENLKVIKRLTEIHCTKRLNSWMVVLSAVIAENYCCTAWRTRKTGMQTVTIGFIGLEDDFEICEKIYKYAVDCVLSKCKEIKKSNREVYTSNYLSKITDAYGYGFCGGVENAFKRQQQEHQEWGLVLLIPAEVRKKAAEMKTTSFGDADFGGPKQQFGLMGFEDGRKFDPSTKLQAASAGGTR